MTRDGRPSKFKDTRLVSGPHNDYLEGCQEAKAFARRLTWWLNGQGISVGSNFVVDVHLDTELPVGSVELGPIDRDADTWQSRDVRVGVPADSGAEDADEVAIDAITRAIVALVPDQAAVVEDAAAVVRRTGARGRFLHRVKESATETLEVSSTIAPWPEPSKLFVGLTDTRDGTYREAPPIDVRVNDDAIPLAAKCRRTRDGVVLDVRGTSFAAHPAAVEGVIRWGRDAFVEVERPSTSGLLSWR